MSLRPILTWPDDRLRTVCTPVEEISADIRDLAADMLETMYDAPGRGLAAPQVGVLARIFVMDTTWKDGTRAPVTCINPDIVSYGTEMVTSTEGCLSIPGVTAEVKRPATVRMVWTDLDGIVQDQEFCGFAALCAQHELDHLDGTVTLDRVEAVQREEILVHYEAT